MPFSAIIDGERKISIFFSDEDWLALRLKNKKIILTCCGGEGYSRKSKYGEKHFVHKYQTENRCVNWKPESEDHLRIKAKLFNSIKNYAQNWQVDVEVYGKKWIADVLATKDNIKLAFEIQLSPQTLEDTIKRQNEYTNSNIKSCWLFWDTPRNRELFLPPKKELPVFFIDSYNYKLNNDNLYINILHENGQDEIKDTLHINDFVDSIFNGYLKFSNSTIVNINHFFYAEKKCFGKQSVGKCEKPIYIVKPIKNERQDCKIIHKKFKSSYKVTADTDKVINFLQEITDKMGKYRFFASRNEQSNTEYICPSCHKLYEFNMYTRDKFYSSSEFFKHRFVSQIPYKIKVNWPHWCYSRDRNFCCDLKSME